MDETWVDAVGEAPIVVRVEIGAAEMPAHAWASSARGTSSRSAVPSPSLVTLRVAGHILAEGELVDIEGEVGVRILRRLPVPA